MTLQAVCFVLLFVAGNSSTYNRKELAEGFTERSYRVILYSGEPYDKCHEVSTICHEVAWRAHYRNPMCLESKPCIKLYLAGSLAQIREDISKPLQTAIDAAPEENLPVLNEYFKNCC